MAIIKADCRICKKKTNHIKIEEFDNLPDYVLCIQCQSCGVMGIELLGDTKEFDCE